MAVWTLGGRMDHFAKRSRTLFSGSLVSLALAIALLLLSGTPAYADTATDFMVTDVRDQYAVASWTTTAAEIGSIEFAQTSTGSCSGLTGWQSVSDARSYASTVHYVQIFPGWPNPPSIACDQSLEALPGAR